MENSSNEDKIQKIYKILAIFSLAIIIITTAYGVIMSIFLGVEIVGQTFVDVEFPPINVFPLFYMKPITWLFFALILALYSLLELKKERIVRVSMFNKKVIKTILFIVACLAIYEVLFNFTLWSGLIASNSLLGELNPDLIINPFPNPETPWNIVFATKLYLALTIGCVYTLYFLSKIELKKDTLP